MYYILLYYYIYIWYNRRSIAFNSPRTKHPLIVLLKVYIIHSSSTNCFFVSSTFFFGSSYASVFSQQGALLTGMEIDWNTLLSVKCRHVGVAAEKGPLMTKRIHFFVWTRIFKKGNGLEGTICIYENIEMMCHISIYVINGVSVCNIYICILYNLWYIGTKVQWNMTPTSRLTTMQLIPCKGIYPATIFSAALLQTTLPTQIAAPPQPNYRFEQF